MRKHCVCLLSLFFTLGIQPQEITILTEENPPFSYKKSEQVTGLMTDVVNELVRETGT